MRLLMGLYEVRGTSSIIMRTQSEAARVTLVKL